MVSRGVNFSIKTGSSLCDLTPKMMNLKSPRSHLFAPSSPINLITMTRDLTLFPPTPSSTRQTTLSGYSFGPQT